MKVLFAAEMSCTSIPFEISQTQDPFFSESNLTYVKKSVQELKNGNGTAHELIEVADE